MHFFFSLENNFYAIVQDIFEIRCVLVGGGGHKRWEDVSAKTNLTTSLPALFVRKLPRVEIQFLSS